MDKSIETIWKEGFQESSELNIPKIKNLYNRKSTDVISRYKRKTKLNLWILDLSGLAGIILAFAFQSQALIWGTYSVFMWSIALYSRTSKTKMKDVDPSLDTYDYLKSYKYEITSLMKRYERLYQWLYPGLAFVVFLEAGMISNIGEAVEKYLPDYNYMIYGMPYLWIGVTLIISIIVYKASPFLFKLDINLLYGRVLRDLDKLISELEELK